VVPVASPVFAGAPTSHPAATGTTRHGHDRFIDKAR